MYPNPEQLLMYVSGMGGIGKSHIIKAIMAFIDLCDARQNLLLTIMIGIVTMLINGHTIHTLTFLPKSKYSKSR